MREGRRRWGVPLAVFTGVVAVFGALAAGSDVLFDQSEDRLLEQRTKEAGLVLRSAVQEITSDLGTAATVAELTGGDIEAVRAALESYVAPNGLYSSAALFDTRTGAALVEIGTPMVLGESAGRALLERATDTLLVVDLLDGTSTGERRLGYAVGNDRDDAEFLVYVERVLGADPNVRRQDDQAFSQLDYAIYLDASDGPTLLGSSVRDLPISGRRHTEAIQFGDQQMLLVATPIGSLSGGLFANLWWLVLVLGVLVALAFATLAARLQRRRDVAIGLARDNERLYDEQRQIAETLQLSLLPQHLDTPPGSAVAARYWPAGAANLIGGDFYDVFRVDERRWGITIGDVCGKGIAAATLTGLARHTIRAAARRSHSPAEVLHSLHLALQDHRPPTFCTACFVFVTVEPSGEQVLDVSLGGHPAPLLRRADGSVEEIGATGTILGMVEPHLTDVRVRVGGGDLLVLYTDGLTDAPRDEAVPMLEVRNLLSLGGGGPIEDVADSIRTLKRRRRPRGSGDDTALLCVRFGGDQRAPDAMTSAATLA